MEEELNNELVVENDVPETSEENLEEVNIGTSEDEEQNQETVYMTETNQEDDIQRQIEERANKLFEEKVEERLIRDRVNRERKQNKELAKYRQLESVIKAGLGVDNLDDAISKTSSFYREQGITIPEYTDVHSERDEKILAKADAQEIIDLGMSEMEAEANRIASIPKEKRSIREQTMFNTLCEKIVEQRQVNELKEKGIKTEILEDKNFKEFKSKFAFNTPISDIYEMYSKLNAKPVEKPASAGSAKNEVGKATETFSAERINNMTPQELKKYWNNPDFRRVAGLN